MRTYLKSVKVSFSAVLLAGAQLSVLLAVVASQAGERILRGARGFAVYREILTGQG